MERRFFVYIGKQIHHHALALPDKIAVIYNKKTDYLQYASRKSGAIPWRIIL